MRVAFWIAASWGAPRMPAADHSALRWRHAPTRALALALWAAFAVSPALAARARAPQAPRGIAPPSGERVRPEPTSDGPATGWRVLDPAKVYYGRTRSFVRPAVVSLDHVFGVIPDYQTIVAEGLPPNDARYWLLLERANKLFAEAVRHVAMAHGYDMICERGALGHTTASTKEGDSVLPDLTVTDLTALVRAEVRRLVAG